MKSRNVDPAFQASLQNREARFQKEDEEKLAGEFEELKKSITSEIKATRNEEIKLNLNKYNRKTIDKIIEYLQDNGLIFAGEEPLHPERGDDPRNNNDISLTVGLPNKLNNTSPTESKTNPAASVVLGMFGIFNTPESSKTRKYVPKGYQTPEEKEKHRIDILRKRQKNRIDTLNKLSDDLHSRRITFETFIEGFLNENPPSCTSHYLEVLHFSE